MKQWNSIEEINLVRKQTGMSRFDHPSFFHIEVYPDLYQGVGGTYYVASEHSGGGRPRVYLVRVVHEDGCIATEDSRTYASLEEAQQAARAYANTAG